MDIDLSIALVGLPNVGKSVIFNLLTGLKSEVSPYPISTPHPIHGVVEWIDPRMLSIASVIRPEKIFPLKLQITDGVGIMPGQNHAVGGFAENLASMRSSDVLCHVVRSFTNPLAVHIHSDFNQNRDSNIFWAELCMIDGELVQNKLTKLERIISKGSKDLDVHFENDLLRNRVFVILKNGVPLCEQVWNEKELKVFDSLTLITHKPHFIVLNYDENQSVEFGTSSKLIKSSPFPNKTVVAICGCLESDILSLQSNEQTGILSLYDGFDLASHRIIPTALNTAGRITYFTFGHLGLKQWSVPKGTTAVGAAKRLHTDFANKFVASEVVTVDTLLEAESVDHLKSQGKMRLEGRDYSISDGDILYFRFGK